jgi:Protein of unknown function (DUF1524)
LTLSRADEQYFREMIRQRSVTPTRDSHHKLSYAYAELRKKVTELAGTASLTDQLDNLEIFKQNIDGDFSLIHMKTKDKKEAYVLFRVLNDKGKSLTDGDLLRARTLEILEGHPSQQSSVEFIWDDILSDVPNTTEEYLRWIYASSQGTRAGANTLFDDFLNVFFPQHNATTITTVEADVVLRTTQGLQSEIQNCRKLTNGEWPFQVGAPITTWDVNRLSLLIKELRITVTMPLLLAACRLQQAQFSDIIQLLERFMFRFKIIGNQHVTPANNIFHAQAVIIRSNPVSYNVQTLRTALHTLQMGKVNDQLFRSLLDNMVYKDGGGNQPIKYFLMTIEYYLRWYDGGSLGDPSCMDKTRIYDYSGTTIEHIYPKNAQGTSVDPALEPLKNRLGNLTFMGPADNNSVANNPFAQKIQVFQQSSVHMNQEIGGKAMWTINEVGTRISRLKDIAIAVFNI